MIIGAKDSKNWLIATAISFTLGASFSHASGATAEPLLELDDLLSLPIVTSSKKVESLFDSPLSAFVLTKDEIKNSGVTTISEAMRLIPGFIVREMTTGNFDVHIRGFDGFPERELWPWSSNSTSLIMIDGRIVYNYFQGGIFWETLPIGLADIEQVEVVRGPSAAMYGPNAVSGVVNIITSRPNKKEGISSKLGGIFGTHSSRSGHASLAYSQGDKFNLTFSTNADARNRRETDYFIYGPDVASFGKNYTDIWNQGQYVPKERFPQPNKALSLWAYNLFLDYKPMDDLKVELEAGHQNSFAQRVYFENYETPLTSTAVTSTYVDLKTHYKDFHTHFSLQTGTQDGLGIRDPLNDANPVYDFRTDFRNADAEFEYNYVNGPLVIRPGFLVRQVAYDGPKNMHGKQHMNNEGLFVRSEYTLGDWRFVGALRADKYSNPSKPYQSWQLAVTRKAGENHLFRFVYSRANKYPTMAENFMDVHIVYALQQQLAPGVVLAWPADVNYNGDPQLTLMTSDMFELGHRAKLTSKIQVDNEAYVALGRNFPGFSEANWAYGAMKDSGGTLNGFPIAAACGASMLDAATCNLPIPKSYSMPVSPRVSQAVQVGWTGSLMWNPNEMISNRFFSSVQHTTFTQGVVKGTHGNTPLLTGGTVTNIKPNQSWNVNVNSAFYSKQTFHPRYTIMNSVDQTLPENALDSRLELVNGVLTPKAQVVPSKLILSAKVAYRIAPQIEAFVSGRNVLSSKNVEFPIADHSGSLYMVGLEASL